MKELVETPNIQPDPQVFAAMTALSHLAMRVGSSQVHIPCTEVLDLVRTICQGSYGMLFCQGFDGKQSLRLMAMIGDIATTQAEIIARHLLRQGIRTPQLESPWLALPLQLQLPEGPLMAFILLGWPTTHTFDESATTAMAKLEQLRDSIGSVIIACLLAERVREHNLPNASSPPSIFENEVLATVSHELRTPLAAIKGFTTTLLRQDRKLSRTERLEFLKEIDEACDRQEMLINRLLRVSHLARATDIMDRELVDMAEMAHEALDSARMNAAKHDVPVYHFVVHLPSTPLRPVFLNAEQIREVCDHLLENAMKYSPEGGTITLTVRPLDLSADKVLARLPGNARVPGYIEVVIADEGLGIPSDQLEAIFQPFHRVDMRLTRDIGGLGIGLAYCRRVIELQGGALWAENGSGLGSAFHIAVPTASKEHVSA